MNTKTIYSIIAISVITTLLNTIYLAKAATENKPPIVKPIVKVYGVFESNPSYQPQCFSFSDYQLENGLNIGVNDNRSAITLTMKNNLPVNVITGRFTIDCVSKDFAIQQRYYRADKILFAKQSDKKIFAKVEK